MKKILSVFVAVLLIVMTSCYAYSEKAVSFSPTIIGYVYRNIPFSEKFHRKSLYEYTRALLSVSVYYDCASAEETEVSFDDIDEFLNLNAMPLAMGKFFQAMKEATGVDMADLMAGDSKSARVERNVHVDAASAGVIVDALKSAQAEEQAQPSADAPEEVE